MTAGELFEAYAQDAERARVILLELEAMDADETGWCRRHAGEPRAKGTPCSNVEYKAGRRAALDSELGAVAVRLVRALEVLEGLRAAAGGRYADVVALRYGERYTWARVAQALGTSTATARRALETALEVVDGTGWARLADVGEYQAHL